MKKSLFPLLILVVFLAPFFLINIFTTYTQPTPATAQTVCVPQGPECVTLEAYENGTHSVIGSTYSFSEVATFYASGTGINCPVTASHKSFGISCNATDGWMLTGCVSNNSGQDTDTCMDSNGCYQDVEDAAAASNILHARCCHFGY